MSRQTPVFAPLFSQAGDRLLAYGLRTEDEARSILGLMTEADT
jgi:hypothetical protein